MSKTIYLDPGHGRFDFGSVNNKRYEKNDNLKIAKIVENIDSTRSHCTYDLRRRCKLQSWLRSHSRKGFHSLSSASCRAAVASSSVSKHPK